MSKQPDMTALTELPTRDIEAERLAKMADYMMHRLRDCFEQKRENRGAKFHERYGKEDKLW